MLANYEINSNTLALIPIGPTTTKVLEKEETFLVNKTTNEIIDDSCKYFGSSYMGRHEGTKHLIGINYKAPIIVEESNYMIFFPTSSPRISRCAWIALNHVENHVSHQNNSILYFHGGKNVELNISPGSLENQILRATKLESTLRKRKMS
ncbi:MAG: competence protein ComK [Firmicutes bacterium]|nr:competence protein ComK [Bacillota bacterium]